MQDTRTETAIGLMTSFAERTGLTSERPQRRYLWTDAFAVCNFIGLARVTGEPRYQQLALQLVDRVHHTLGRHREDDPRTGWLSGQSDRDGERHPTRAGLRIGKALPERGANQPMDARLEWDRDGQYFHYLTRWMHALDLVARATGQPRFNEWARELAATAYAHFTYGPGRARMYWKMSIDLTRPQVPSMGHHDPLDGFVTFAELRATARAFHDSTAPSLDAELSGFRAMVADRDWATPDPLGIGGLLVAAHLVTQLMRTGALADSELLERMLSDALAGIERYSQQRELDRPAEARLAFRELGLAIGLYAVERMWSAAKADPARTTPAARASLEALAHHLPLRRRIESFWLEPAHRAVGSFTDHRDINEVMLATSLVPEGCLLILPPVAP